jgi:hypothetical protein
MITPTREQLIEAQLHFYPDSRIMSLSEVYREWMDGDGPMDSWETNFNEYYGRIYRDPVEKKRQLCDYVIKQRQDYRVRVARCLALCLQNEANLFYECGLKDGEYQYRGCRYGIEGPDYMSGFGKD